LVAQRCLADTGLADEQDQRAVTFCRRFERRLQLAKFSLAADEGLPLGKSVLSRQSLYGLIGCRWVRVPSHGWCRAL
jgi:hypothetical protein